MNEDYLNYINNKLVNNFDVKYRVIEKEQGLIHAIFVDDMCDSKFISDNIINPLVRYDMPLDTEKMKQEVLFATNIGEVLSKKDAITHILSGDVVLISDFLETIIFCEAKGFAKRGVSIPLTESVIKGPREGFTESFVDNIGLLRRKIKNEDLKFEPIYLGEKSNTVVIVSYISGVAPDDLVQYIKNKVEEIDIEFILDTNFIEETLGAKHTIADTIGYSEKPDIVASKLMEGRVAIIVDGTPMVITAPYFFVENFHMADDYYINKYFTNLTRLQRWVGFLIALLTPGLYVAITTYHFTLIPSAFVFRLSISRSGVPFPTVIEVLLMMSFFQLLREAGIRIPQPIGQAVSIVGAPILGQSAVGAGLASQSTIMVVAVSSIATYLTPKLYKVTSIWSVIILLFASFLGLPGFYLGFMVFVTHVASLESCGYPYMYPLGSLKFLNYRDIVIRNDLSEVSNTIFDKDDALTEDEREAKQKKQNNITEEISKAKKLKRREENKKE